MFNEYERITWKVTEDYIVEYEIYEGNLYAHATVYKNPKQSFKKIKHEDWPKFKEHVRSLGFDEFFTYTNNLRFCRALQEYEYLGNTGHIPEMGKSYNVICWSA